MKNICIKVLLMISISLIACKQEKYESDNSIPEPKALNISTLKEAPYPMGVAVNMGSLPNNQAYRNIILTEMSSITAENAMKMSVISLGRQEYDFADADYIVDFGQANNLRIHGHTLIWARKLPPTWILDFVGTKEEWKTIMKEYIHDVVGRYKGRITSWDVVNEIINDDGTYADCVWLKNIGPEYIELAFRYAHEADPDAILIYNDYGHTYSHTRRMAVNRIANELVSKGVPIHGLGLQMHTHINRTPEELRNSIMAAATTKLKIHISELDIKVNPDNVANAVFTAEMAEKQKIRFRAVAKAMMDLPDNQRYGITTWGVHDGSSFTKNDPDWALIFDNDFQRKPAYEGLLQGFYK